MKFYKQTTNYTGSSSALMCILNHLGKIELNKDNELGIWLKSIVPPTRASSVFGLALIAHEIGLDIEIVIEDFKYTYPDYRFKRYTKKQILLAETIANRYRDLVSKEKIKVTERDFGMDFIDELLGNNKILLLRVNAGVLRGTKSTSKYIVVYGKEDGKYLVLDPRKGLKKISKEILKESMVELKTKKKRDKAMIVF